MSIVFKPNGTLNIGTAATDLPEESGQGSTLSEAMQRCKNLSLQRSGRADTRHGSSTVHQLPTFANFLIEQSGDVYAFTGATIYRDTVAIGTGDTDAQWTALVYNQYNDTTEQVFAANGTDRKRIVGSTVYEWGITAPSSAPSVTTGATTGLTGTYSAKITYARKVGSTVVSESNPSSASGNQALTNQSLSVSWSASSDPQVTHVRVYRTLSGGSVYYHDQDVAVGTTSVDTNTTDANLTSQVETDHDRPPSGANIVVGPVYGGTVFAAVGNLLYYCKPKQPEYFPSTYYIEVGAPQHPILALAVYDGQVYACTNAQIWWIQGVTTGVFQPVPLESMAGAWNNFAALGVKGYGLFHVAGGGLYVYSGGRDSEVTQNAFNPLFDGMDVNDIPAVRDSATVWIIQHHNEIWMHWGAGSVLLVNLDTKRTSYHKYPTRLRAPTVDRTEDRLLASDSAGRVVRLDDPAKTVDYNDGAIEWEIESKDFALQTRAHFPRWAKYDVAGTATAKIVLEGEVHQTHALTVGRDVRHRLIDVGNGQRCSIRISGSGTATVYAAEME